MVKHGRIKVRELANSLWIYHMFCHHYPHIISVYRPSLQMKILVFLFAVGLAKSTREVSEEDFENLVKQVQLLEATVEGLEDQNASTIKQIAKHEDEIQELQEENKELKDRVKALEADNEKLNEKVDRLEVNILT